MLTETQTPPAAEEPQQLDAAALIQSLQPTGEAPVVTTEEAPVDLIADVPADKFFAGLDTLSGGLVKDRETFKRVTDEASRASTLQQRLNELEARQQISPFHTPLAERINQLAGEGRSPQEILQFVELNSLDLTKLDPIEAIRRNLALSKPGWDADKIDGLIEQTLGFDPSEEGVDLSKRQKAALQDNYEQAIEGLKKHQVAAENPAAVEAAKQAQADHARIVDTWQQVIPTLQVVAPIVLAVADDTQTTLTFQPDPRIIAEAQKEVLEIIQSQPDQYKTNPAIAAEVQRWVMDTVAFKERARREETIARHAYAEGLQAALQRTNSNGAPLTRIQGQQQQVPVIKKGSPDASILID